MGNSLVSQWKLDQAAKQFEQWLKIEPNHAEKAAFLRGLCWPWRGRERSTRPRRPWAGADANPNSLGPLRSGGRGLWVHGQAKEAEDEFPKDLGLRRAELSESPRIPDNDRAFIMATCPIQSLRNAAEAVKLAERANKKTGENHLDILDTPGRRLRQRGPI